LLFGYNNGTIKNLGSAGNINITGSGTSYVGGIAGCNYGIINNCCNTSTASGISNVGGIAGENDDIISSCYNTGFVTGSGNFVVGITGYNVKTISNCYNTGKVFGNSNIGGIAGIVIRGGSISDCYNIGAVAERENKTGGIAGVNNGGTIKNCYYLNNSSSSMGTSEAVSCDQAEMQNKDTYIVFFSTDTVWQIEPSSFYPYPQLKFAVEALAKVKTKP